AMLHRGGNDKGFLWSLPWRSSNIEGRVNRLTELKIRVIVFDPDVEWKYYQWDFIHFSNEGHAWIAATLLPQVIAAITPPAAQPAVNRSAKPARPAPASGKSR